MRAVVCTQYGPPEVLQIAEVKRPTPRRNQIRIRVVATSVSVSDCVVRGLRAPRLYRFVAQVFFGFGAPRQPILGMVVAGDVESVGRSVTSFKVGDQIFGFSQWLAGAYAEEVCWRADGYLAPRPKNLSYEEAAALPYGGLLALHCLRKANIQPGQSVLVYGASGAIGTSAVQLARHFGARVTGVCSAANLELVESLGAGVVIDYTRDDFRSRTERYDLVFDAVGKRKSATAMRDAGRSLKTGGKCISIDDDLPRPTRENLDLLTRLAESGDVKPVIDRMYPLEEIVEAHRYVELGHKKGNVIVTVAPRS